ncbi:MAG: YjbE family putative metal transport protein [Chloroflexota bacterium]|nr:YjbE family putative metal transport protein [Chloroflexota bacterium]
MDLSAIIAIVLIDLALSGDNALLIGMAARRLPDAQRRRAIVLGGALAVVLRVAAAAVVSFLLAIPYLQLTGGVVLAIIAYRLVRPSAAEGHSSVQPAGSMREAVWTILVADAAMSVENVLGVGGAAHGDLPLLGFGLIVSIPIVLFGSGIIARMLDRAPNLIWVGALALIWTSADMILGDPALDPHVTDHWIISAVAALAILGAIVGMRALRHRTA